MSVDAADKKNRLLRKAAYWISDYASAFRTSPEPAAQRFREKLIKLAAQCRKASSS